MNIAELNIAESAARRASRKAARRRHLLLRLLYIPGAIQLDSGKGRRAAIDCPDHDLLGRDFCVIRFRAFDFRRITKLRFIVLR